MQDFAVLIIPRYGLCVPYVYHRSCPPRLGSARAMATAPAAAVALLDLDEQLLLMLLDLLRGECYPSWDDVSLAPALLRSTTSCFAHLQFHAARRGAPQSTDPHAWRLSRPRFPCKPAAQGRQLAGLSATCRQLRSLLKPMMTFLRASELNIRGGCRLGLSRTQMLSSTGLDSYIYWQREISNRQDQRRRQLLQKHDSPVSKCMPLTLDLRVLVHYDGEDLSRLRSIVTSLSPFLAASQLLFVSSLTRAASCM
eukprot:6213358-Pleurochrysis_carterae.AAC.1